MTEPLTPPDCDLTDFSFMPLDVSRLFSSEFHAVASDSEWRAGVTLWAKSWHQVPAASLPDDDIMLARLAEFGRDVKGWKKVRTGALRGWITADDGRLYHPVVAEKALGAWLEKLAQRLSSGAGNAKRWSIPFDPAPVRTAMDNASAMLARLDPQSRSLAKAARRKSQRDPDGTPVGTPIPIPSGSQGTGTGTGNSKESFALVVPASPEPTSPPPSSARKRPVYPAEFEAAWKAYPHVEGRSSKPDALAEWKLLPADEQQALPAAIARFRPKVSEACGDRGAPCMSRWLKKGKHLNFQAGGDGSQTVRPEIWAQAVKLWRNGEGWSDTLGPAPDQPGTRVPRELLVKSANGNARPDLREAG